MKKQDSLFESERLRLGDAIDMTVASLKERLKDLHRPTHGPCCTCQRCGKSYDDCRCDLDEVVEENDALKQRAEAAEQKVSQMEEPAKFGWQCYQDRCENAYVEASVVKRLEQEKAEEYRRFLDAVAKTGEQFRRAEAAEAERDSLAAALERQAAKCDLWQSTFESIPEESMDAEAHNSLSAVYDLTNDAEAQDNAAAILARVRAEERKIGAVWACKAMAANFSEYAIGGDPAVPKAIRMCEDFGRAIQTGTVEVEG